jgi:hypothetical protein
MEEVIKLLRETRLHLDKLKLDDGGSASDWDRQCQSYDIACDNLDTLIKSIVRGGELKNLPESPAKNRLVFDH